MTGIRLVTWPTFDEALKRLKKKYPHVEDDLKSGAQNPGPPRAIPGFAHKLWKLRIGSRDQQRGRRGGFRLIYYMDPSAAQTMYLVTIYAKNECEDLSAAELVQIYGRFLAFLREHVKSGKD